MTDLRRRIGRPRLDMAAPEVLRVLVVGQVLSGKTTLLHALCHGDARRARRSISRTVGCHTEASVHTGYDGATYHVEWLEVGAASQHRDSRGVFFRDCDGILAVFDAGSDRSFAAVVDWLEEAAAHLADSAARLAAQRHRGGRDGSRRHVDGEEEAGPPSTRRRAAGGAGALGSGDARARSDAPRPAGAAPARRLSAGSDVLPQSRVQLMAACLRDTPILLVANKADTVALSARAGAGGGGGPAGWRHAITSGSSRAKLEVQLRAPDARSVTICGLSCRRPRTHRVTLDVPVVAAVSATLRLGFQRLPASRDCTAHTPRCRRCSPRRSPLPWTTCQQTQCARSLTRL